MNISFEWDEAKAHANLKKHHVSFEIAARVFLDPLALAYQDRIENGEHRWQTLGMVDGCLLLLVAHTVRNNVMDARFPERHRCAKVEMLINHQRKGRPK